MKFLMETDDICPADLRFFDCHGNLCFTLDCDLAEGHEGPHSCTTVDDDNIKFTATWEESE